MVTSRRHVSKSCIQCEQNKPTKSSTHMHVFIYPPSPLPGEEWYYKRFLWNWNQSVWTWAKCSSAIPEKSCQELEETLVNFLWLSYIYMIQLKIWICKNYASWIIPTIYGFVYTSIHLVLLLTKLLKFPPPTFSPHRANTRIPNRSTTWYESYLSHSDGFQEFLYLLPFDRSTVQG